MECRGRWILRIIATIRCAPNRGLPVPGTVLSIHCIRVVSAAKDACGARFVAIPR